MMEKYQPKPDKAEILAEQVKTVNPTLLQREWTRLIPVYRLPDDHPCKVYVRKRMIPKEWERRLWWCDTFFEWTNLLIPDKFSEKTLEHDEGRLIIPLISKDKKIFGYQGRSIKENLDKGEQRYYTLILDSTQPKIFGLDRLDMDRKFYVTEGPIDSMFIPNSAAMVGGILFGNENAVIVYDNEPRSVKTCKKIQKAINRGYKVCIWPTSWEYKDVNDMVLNNMTPSFIKQMIDERTYSGMEATLVFNEWKRR